MVEYSSLQITCALRDPTRLEGATVTETHHWTNFPFCVPAGAECDLFSETFCEALPTIWSTLLILLIEDSGGTDVSCVVNTGPTTCTLTLPGEAPMDVTVDPDTPALPSSPSSSSSSRSSGSVVVGIAAGAGFVVVLVGCILAYWFGCRNRGEQMEQQQRRLNPLGDHGWTKTSRLVGFFQPPYGSDCTTSHSRST